ncbi:LysE family translocator [Amphritea pacifica]|uniref:LysE family translocator n=1 Tax=Amphritea pacifica TaxID=2811233 RepID=A0ABS2WCX9_9GAMM|nr:LysE family translocator [Amphritea pacifica]MBN0989471.1 LysE family translocator [Amphritea pacifica]MBN1008832.1 LysE family translocator [Amphritea pacifica]
MDLLQGLALISAVHFLAAASPGPDFVLVSQQTLTNGRKAGFMCSIGIALGLSVHIFYSSLGLAAVLANSETALWVIKILGGSYLIYLGIVGVRSSSGRVRPSKTVAVDISAGRHIITGFVCNVLNPKAPVYFISLFTVVLSPEMPLVQIAVYGAWMMLIQLMWFSAVVTLLSNPGINRRFKRLGSRIDRLLGATMIILGLKVIFTRV